MPGIEPGAFHMQSERSTTELHPPRTASVRLLGSSRNVLISRHIMCICRVTLHEIQITRIAFFVTSVENIR